MSEQSKTKNPLKGESKVSRIPIKIEPTVTPLRKPKWIRGRSHNAPEVERLKRLLREQQLHTVCAN